MKNTLKLILATTFLICASVDVAIAQKKKKITVGELLRKVKEDSRGGNLKSMEKGDTVVPNAQFNFGTKRVNLQTIKPPKSTEMHKYESGGDQAEYEKTLDRQINELYGLTKKFDNSPNRGELWLRLAELYVEKSTLVDQRKQDVYDRQLKAFQDGKTKVKPQLDTQESRQYNTKAIQLYEWFLRDYPKDEKVGQALFFLGYNYFELGDTDKGMKYYETLTKDHPRSPYLGEASFSMGEYYFDNEKWAEAYREYAKIIKNKKHRLNAFALYKGAWCLYRMGKTEEAIKYLDFIIRAGKGEDGDSLTRKSINRNKLENEALRDIVVFYSDTGDVKRAVNYFKNLGGVDSNAYIERLAYYYADKGARDASRDVFHMLIEEDPTAKKAIEYQYQIVQNYFYAKNSPQFKEELYKWINNYRKDSAWADRNKGDKAFVENSLKLREQTLRNYVLQQHQTAQNSRAAYSRQTALEGYQLYFQEFSDSPQASDMHFFYAELLYDLGRYEEASVHYSWVVENAPKSKYASKAGQNTLLAIEKALPKDDELQKKVGNSVDPIPLDPRVERFIKSAQWYTDKFPNSEKNAEIKFRVGRLYYQTNHFNEAEVIFKDIVNKYPKTKYSEYSANLLLDIYNIKKDYVGLEKVGNELLANDSIASSKAGSDIRGVLERASFKKAQDLAAEKRYLEAAEQFQAFATQNPKSDLASTALFNAGVNFESAGRNYEATQSYKKVLASNDKNAATYKARSEKLLAKLYQDSGQFEESAKLFSKIAKDDPKDKLAPNYLYNSAIMYEALGRNREALNSYNDFLQVNKSRKENAEATFSVAALMRKSNSLSASMDKYDEFTQLSNDGVKRVEAYYWIYEMGRKTNKITRSDEAKAAAIQNYNRLSSDKKSAVGQYIAKIKYQDAVTLYNEMRAVKIPANPQKQKEAVDKKLSLVAKTSEALTDTIKVDSAEEIVDSLNLLGETNDHIGHAIINAPLPAGFNDEQKKQYMAGIQKIAEPFLKKSEDGYKAAVDRARELGVYPASYRNALSKMNDKDSKQYYDGPEVTSESKLIQWIGDK
ncbi:MAG: tetratricopeptide repeat protein [Pseudobdellovibrio sp.]